MVWPLVSAMELCRFGDMIWVYIWWLQKFHIMAHVQQACGVCFASDVRLISLFNTMGYGKGSTGYVESSERDVHMKINDFFLACAKTVLPDANLLL